ncbi:MAG TPA: hypothetical protein VI636_24100 [Candidatus Angelobacter sp.]
MAEQETNETPEQETSVNFEEAKGKIIESIKVNAESGHYNIDINFTDSTALILDVEPFVTVFPRLADFKTGDLEPLKEWKPITSIPLRD